MNEEFRKLTRGFHQNMFDNVSSMEEMVSEALFSIEPKDVPGAKAYLDELLSGKFGGGQLQKIWRSSLADVYFNDDADLLKALQLLRSAIDVHPYLNRTSANHR